MNTLDAFTVMVSVVLNGTSSSKSTDRTDAMLVPDELLISDSLSNYCLRKIRLMGVSTFAKDYLDHIVQLFGGPDDTLGNTATSKLGPRYFRSMILDTPFPQALSIANEQPCNPQAEDPGEMAVFQAIKALSLSFQRPQWAWRQKLTGRWSVENTLPEDTLAPSPLSARSSSQMSLDTRSFPGCCLQLEAEAGSKHKQLHNEH